jgi:uncharacterized protein YciI
VPQAKRYTHRHVGRPDIQAFVGALRGAPASRGILIATSPFSSDARDYAERVNARLVLIDDLEFAALMIEHDCGVVVEEPFVLKQVDENYFEDLQARLRVLVSRSAAATASPRAATLGKMFVVLITYTAPVERINELIPPHKVWMTEQYVAGIFLASGAQTPRTGAVILARGGDRKSLEALLAQDPVAQAGLADYQVVEFAPTTTAPGFEILAAG